MRQIQPVTETTGLHRFTKKTLLLASVSCPSRWNYVSQNTPVKGFMQLSKKRRHSGGTLRLVTGVNMGQCM